MLTITHTFYIHLNEKKIKVDLYALLGRKECEGGVRLK